MRFCICILQIIINFYVKQSEELMNFKPPNVIVLIFSNTLF